jgi:hypothetical protein
MSNLVDWRDIPGYEGIYRINRSGVVYCVKRGWQIRSFVPKCGYWSVNLSDANGSRTCAQVHRLLALAFIDGMTSKDRVSFKNGDKLDCRLENLFVIPRVEKVVSPPKSFEERFWENVEVYSFLDCWLWLGSKNNAGYGSLSNDGDSIMAHRASWLIHFGDIPSGLVVMHKCDNPPCVNPSHFQLGTYSDNMQDAIKKGRFKIRSVRIYSHETEKVCKVCGKVKPMEEFPIYGRKLKDGTRCRRQQCRVCYSQKRRTQRQMT